MEMMMRRVIRVHRKDSAFVYAILESLDGMVSLSTLTDDSALHCRDIELRISSGFQAEIEAVITGLRRKFPVLDLNPGD